MLRRRDAAFCFGVAGTQKAPWRPSKQEAQLDAIDAKYASIDPGSKTVYMTVPGEIWTTHELVPALPRGPLGTQKISDDPFAGLSRIERIIARREGKVARR